MCACPRRPSDLFTFCVVRDPAERLVSEYKYEQIMWHKKPCSAGGMNKWVANILQHVYSNNIYAEYCHLLPQVACKSVVKGTRLVHCSYPVMLD